MRVEAALRPRQVDTSGGVDGHRRIGVGAERQQPGDVGGGLVERREVRRLDRLADAALLEEHVGIDRLFFLVLLRLVGFLGLVELLAAGRVGHDHQRVVVARQVETAPRDVDVAVARIDGDGGALVGTVGRVVEQDRRRPRVAAIGRAREEHVVAVAQGVARLQRVGEIDGARRQVLRDRALLAGRRDDAARVVARDVDGQPRLVEKVAVDAAGVGGDLPSAKEDNRVACFLVVVVDEARDEDGALAGYGAAGRAAIEGEARVVEQAVGARAHDGIGAGAVTVNRASCRVDVQRLEGIAQLVLRITRQQIADPSLSAVERLEEAEPRVAGFITGQARQIHGAVVVGAAEQMERVARRRCDRWFVLPLQERIAQRPCRSRHHVDVAPGDLGMDG